MSLLHAELDSSGISGEVSGLLTSEDCRFGEFSFGYSRRSFVSYSPDRIGVPEDSEVILTSQDDHVRGVYYANDTYRVYTQSLSFVGLLNEGHFNRADFLNSILTELSGMGGNFSGRVIDNLVDQPLPGALIEIDEIDRSLITDDQGCFDFGPIGLNRFTVNVTAFGYTPVNSAEVTFEENDELRVDFRLFHPVFSIEDDEISTELDSGSVNSIPFSVLNSGDGPLSFSSRLRSIQVEGDNWAELSCLNDSRPTHDSELMAAIFFRDHFWAAGANNGAYNPNMLYKFNRDGELVDSWEQASDSDLGWQDMTHDGEFIYAVDARYIVKIDPDEGVSTGDTIMAPFIPTKSIAWDSVNDCFWVAGSGTHIVAIDRNGNEINRIRINPICDGLSFFADDEDGCPLYLVINSPEASGRLHKCNPENGQLIHVANLAIHEGEKLTGCCITDELYEFTWTLITQTSGRPADYIRNYEIATDFHWLEVEPGQADDLEPDSDAEIILNFNASDLEADRSYRAFLKFDHNTPVEHSIWMEISMTVTEDEDVTGQSEIPYDSRIVATYPNPFNGQLKVSCELQTPSQLTVSVIDLSGRLIYENHLYGNCKGENSLVIDASSWTSGTYLVEIDTPQGMIGRSRVVCIK